MEIIVSTPDVYIKLRKLMEDRGSSIDDFSAVVSNDSQLSLALLNTVNSDFFGLPEKVDSIARAVNLLGIGQVYELVLGIFEVCNREQLGGFGQTLGVHSSFPAH